LHLYDNSELNWHLENGVGLKITQKTNHPWDGMAEVTVTPAQPTNFTFYLRIPGWADRAQVAVNGKAIARPQPGEYLPISRQWSAGDVIHLRMEMPVQVLQANPQVGDDAGRVALQRGPIVYCMESLDQPEGVAMTDLAVELGKKPESQFQSELQPDLLGGVVVIRHPGIAYDKSASRRALYSRYGGQPAPSRKVALTFIPYYAWSNRQQTSMQVWTPVINT
jgi:DUF1680 family protein